MKRQKTVNALLGPLDRAIGLALDAARRSEVFDTISDASYRTVNAALRAHLEIFHELEVVGAENVPVEGGVLLASNHQSWMDIQVLTAGCPRRVHFVSKSEHREEAIVRHLVELSQSVFVDRRGDPTGMQAVVAALRAGKAVGIYPEGTIPGEETTPRQAVDPSTGLLPGKTGTVRLAVEANVPIIPVGVSGVGRAFPPEIYPRLELLRLPSSTPIRIRFGRPMVLSQYHGKELTKANYRELTQELMREISRLVDHQSNYVPLEVPVPSIPKHSSIGVLLLHGFTSSTATVDGLIPYLERAEIPYERPILRGHGTRYQDLRGVRAKDWYVDAERALLSLSQRVDRVVVIGLSMGGLLTLDLAGRHPERIAGIVTVAAPLRFRDPLSRLAPIMSKMVRYWPSPGSFHDPGRAFACRNYPRFPTDAFESLYAYSRDVKERLPCVHVPTLVIAARKDQVVAPESANIIYEKISSPVREIEWFERSGHEMMQDMEAEAVFDRIMSFVTRFKEGEAGREKLAG